MKIISPQHPVVCLNLAAVILAALAFQDSLLARTRDNVPCSPVPGAVSLQTLDRDVVRCVGEGKYTELRAELKKKISRVKPGTAGESLSAGLVLLCCQHELLLASNDAESIRGKDQAGQFMLELLANAEWMQDLLCSGPVNVSNALKGLYSVWRYERKSINTPLYRKIATAGAIAGGSDYQLVHAFRNYRNAYEHGLLQWDFDKLEVWELRHVIARIPQQDWDFILNERNNKGSTYFGACWAVAYRLRNDFNHSIHAHGYYTPWEWYGHRFQSLALVGGVCGSCSTYGSYSSKVHGYPSYTAGEPGHCAYVLRIKPDDWRTAYSVTGHTRPHGCFWRGFVYSDLHLMEQAFRNKEAVRTGYHYTWIARTRHERANLEPLFQSAIRANPLNLGIWQEYGDWLAARPDQTTSQWHAFSKGCMESYRAFPDVISYLHGKYLYPNLKKTTPLDGRLREVLAYQAFIYTLEKPRTGQNLSADIAMFEKLLDNNDKSVFELYSGLLKLAMANKSNRDFLTVFETARKRFSAKKDFIKPFNELLARYTKSSSAQGNELKAVITNCLVDNIKKRDFAGYKNSVKLIGNIVDLNSAKERHVGNWITKCPKHEPFPGKMISKGGMIWPTNAGKGNAVLSYPGILNGIEGGGTCQTGNVNNPTIDFSLPEKCHLSGVIITSGYEHPNWIKAMNPVVLSASNDLKTWTEIYRSDEAKPSHRIDLQGKNIEARYLRLQSPCVDKAAKKQIVLRQFLVFGKTNY